MDKKQYAVDLAQLIDKRLLDKKKQKDTDWMFELLGWRN